MRFLLHNGSSPGGIKIFLWKDLSLLWARDIKTQFLADSCLLFFHKVRLVVQIRESRENPPYWIGHRPGISYTLYSLLCNLGILYWICSRLPASKTSLNFGYWSSELRHTLQRPQWLMLKGFHFPCGIKPTSQSLIRIGLPPRWRELFNKLTKHVNSLAPLSLSHSAVPFPPLLPCILKPRWINTNDIYRRNGKL